MSDRNTIKKWIQRSCLLVVLVLACNSSYGADKRVVKQLNVLGSAAIHGMFPGEHLEAGASLQLAPGFVGQFPIFQNDEPDPMAPAAAGTRQLAQRVKRQAGLRGMRSIVVTSPLSGDGKTTTSCNLAIALTSLDRSRSVVLVDLDLRRPSVAESLGLPVRHGVDEVLAKKVSLDDALIQTNVPGLNVLAVMRGTSNPESLLSSESLTDLIRSLEKRFSMVIIDTPPILSVSDATSVIDVAHGCLLVVRAGRSPAASVRSAVEHLPAEKMLGCCLNFARRSEPVSNYGYYPVAPVQEAGSDDSPEVRG